MLTTFFSSRLKAQHEWYRDQGSLPDVLAIFAKGKPPYSKSRDALTINQVAQDLLRKRFGRRAGKVVQLSIARIDVHDEVSNTSYATLSRCTYSGGRIWKKIKMKWPPSHAKA
jgi:hypothetical protein